MCIYNYDKMVNKINSEIQFATPLLKKENSKRCCGSAWSQGCPLVGMDSGAAPLEMPGSGGAVAHACPPHATSMWVLAPGAGFLHQGFRMFTDASLVMVKPWKFPCVHDRRMR